MTDNLQILKCREDKVPVQFSRCSSAKEDPAFNTFQLADSRSTDWAKSGETFDDGKIRSRVEPWLTALFQSEHLSLLVGSGLSSAMYNLATGRLLSGMGWMEFDHSKEALNAAVEKAAKEAGRGRGNVEDQIRVANELIRGYEILGTTDATYRKKAELLAAELDSKIEDFADSVLRGERETLRSNIEKRTDAFNYLVSFLMSFASRTGIRDRLHLFTTNYDRFLEAGADIAGLHLMDRFVGTLAPVFRSSRLDVDLHYNPPGIRGEPRYLEGVARFTKLHGSLDWVRHAESIHRIGLPFGAEEIRPYLPSCGGPSASAPQLMIYPNSAKDWETTLYPYADLFRDLATATCRPNSTLVTFGYGFGDDHINRIIEDMLTIPSCHLVILAYGDPLDRIMTTYDRLGRAAQITLLIGDHLGDLQQLVDNYLPKPAIDRTTFRMAELLKSRWTFTSQSPDGESGPNGEAASAPSASGAEQ